MSNLVHKTDGGFMEKKDNGVKCQKCGYFLKQAKLQRHISMEKFFYLSIRVNVK